MAIEIASGLCFAGAGILARGKIIDGLIAGTISGVAGALMVLGIRAVCKKTRPDEKIQGVAMICLSALVGGLAAYFGIKAVCPPLSLLRAGLIVLAGALTTVCIGEGKKKLPNEMQIFAPPIAVMGFSTLATGAVLIAAVGAKALGFGK